MIARLLRPTLSELWAFLAIALPVLGALLAPMPAVDLAYHLRAGAQILDGGGIPTTETWTFTIAGTPWPDQQWLAQLLLAAVDQVGGWTGLAVLRAGLVAATFGMLYLVVRRRGPSLGARPAALLVLAAFIVAAPALALRPQLFAMVLFAATLVVLADRAAHPRRVWLIPLFAVLWANLHGTFPLVIGVTGLAALADLRDLRGGGGLRGALRLPMLAVTAVSALATLINHLGVDAWTYVVRLATNPTIGSRVSEWRPPGVTDVPGLLFWLSVAAVVAFLGLRAARRRRAAGLPALPPWPALLTLAAFATLGAVTGRGLAWWPLAAVFVCAGFIVDAPTGITDGNPDSRRTRRSPLNALVAGILLVAGIALLPVWRPVGAAGVPLGTLSYAPQGVAAFLTGNGGTNLVDPYASECDIRSQIGSRAPRIWAPQHWTSWFELMEPRAVYAVDSRIELFPTATWNTYDSVEAGTVASPILLGMVGADFVITEAGVDTGLEAALESNGNYARLHSDPDGSVWGATSC